MDPLTQGVLGAAAAQAVAPRERTVWAGVLGGLSGMAPDLDVLIRSAEDPLLFLEYHRQFTHSLVFIPIGGLICAIVLFALVRRRMSFGSAYLYCVGGYATHGLLDACTSYGTQLFWPFSNLRIAWNNVSVIDPLVTLPLLAFVSLSTVRAAPVWARLGCVWVVLYLSLGVLQRERVESFGESVAASRGHEVVEVVAKPAFANLLLWKTIYAYEDRYYVDAARMGWRPRSFEGESVPALVPSRDLAWLDPASTQGEDLERFRWFSGGYIALDPVRGDRVIDVRYSMIPNRIEALWGIEIDPSVPPSAHARFFTSREVGPERRAEILQMLFDEPPLRD
ncbi:MAG: metal-dependent hydrolase [Candidatus Binatia bacterium]|nr:metal-dependent hydrolase [Candidatus Binatia bacterium]